MIVFFAVARDRLPDYPDPSVKLRNFPEELFLDALMKSHNTLSPFQDLDHPSTPLGIKQIVVDVCAGDGDQAWHPCPCGLGHHQVPGHKCVKAVNEIGAKISDGRRDFPPILKGLKCVDLYLMSAFPESRCNPLHRDRIATRRRIVVRSDQGDSHP
jgi:hypothetical protein